MATAADSTTRMRRAIALAARGLGSTSPNPVVGCVILDAAGRAGGRGLPPARRRPARRGPRAARGGRAGPRRHRVRHPRTLQPHRPHRPLRPGADRGRDRPRRLRGRRPRPRRPPAAPTPCAPPGSTSSGGLLADEAEAGNAAWLTSVRLGRPYVAVEVRRHPRRPDRRRRRHQPLDHLRPSPAPTCTGCAPRPTPSSSAPAPPRADDPHLAVRGVDGAAQPLRVVVDTDATAVRPGARVLDDAAPTLIAVAEDADTAHLAGRRASCGCPAPPTAGLDVPALLAALHERGVRSVLLEGGPTLAGAFVAAGAVDKVVGYLAPVLLGAGPAALADAGITTIAAGVAARRDRDRPHRPRPAHHRRPRPPRPEGELSVHRNRRRTGRGRRRREPRRRLPLPAARPRRHRRRQARRLHRRQRRLPHRRRLRRRRVHRRCDGRDPEPLQPRRARRPAPGSTWSAPWRVGGRLGGHIVQGHVDGTGTHHRAQALRELGDRQDLPARRTSPATSSRRARSPSTASASPSSTRAPTTSPSASSRPPSR